MDEYYSKYTNFLKLLLKIYYSAHFCATSKILLRGMQACENVGLPTRRAYNTAVVGNISVEFVGIRFDRFRIIKKYWDGHGQA